MDFDFTQPAPVPDTLAQCHQLIAELWQHSHLQEQLILKLKTQKNLNANNSSMPPSSDNPRDKANRKKKDDWRLRTAAHWQKRRQGAQRGHLGKGRQLLPASDIHEIVSCYPEPCCAACGGEIKASTLCQRKQIFDLPVGKLWITEYQIYAGKCVQCNKRCRGKLPMGVSKGILGANALARIATLSSKYRQSKREIREFLVDFFGLVVSVGTISNAEGIVAKALEKPVQAVGQAVQKADFIHADETSYSKSWALQWLWVSVTATLTFFKLYPNRNKECARKLIGECYKGMLISDRYAAYNWLLQQQRQYCWAHLKRDFKKISERDNPQEALIGYQLLDIFKHLFYHYGHICAGTDHPGTGRSLLNTVRQFRRIFLRGKQLENTQTATFCAKLIREWRSLWHFLRNPAIEPTNNGAERALRHGVLWRKKCYGTQSERGNLYVERSLTVVMSCKQQKRNILEFITGCAQAFHGVGIYPTLVN